MTKLAFDAAHKADRLSGIWTRRMAATLKSTAATIADDHFSTSDETFPYLFNFTKGLQHTQQGLLQDAGADGDDIFETGGGDYGDFVRGTREITPSVFDQVQLAGARRWESPTGGFAYALQGPDAQAIATPEAPSAGSTELSAEMAEVYQMALLRDAPVAAFMAPASVAGLSNAFATAGAAQVDATAARLSDCFWFKGQANASDTSDTDIRDRRRFGVTQTAETLFRGIGEGTQEGPLVSQFMVMGTGDITTNRSGLEVRFGNQRIPQDTRIALPGVDHMYKWDDWLAVQNAANTRDQSTEFVKNGGDLVYRPILTLRDLATYVHDDQLYQAYLNAALLLLSEGFAADEGIPYHGSHNRAPFAVFGGPHLLTMLTEVSALALRAVRFQKFSVHRRLRPEGMGARYHTVLSGYDPSGTGAFGAGATEAQARSILAGTLAPTLLTAGQVDDGLYKTLEEVRLANDARGVSGSWLLPMAFPEGSPMHPSYGAGHATVAGACVTVLKAFFEMGVSGSRVVLSEPSNGRDALVVVGNDKDDTAPTVATLSDSLSLVGELNKLAWNIANGRNMAGVHYFTDSIESLMLGEAMALGILREQTSAYDAAEMLNMTVPLFVPRKLPAALLTEGAGVQPNDVVSEVRIDPDGVLHAV